MYHVLYHLCCIYCIGSAFRYNAPDPPLSGILVEAILSFSGFAAEALSVHSRLDCQIMTCAEYGESVQSLVGNFGTIATPEARPTHASHVPRLTLSQELRTFRALSIAMSLIACLTQESHIRRQRLLVSSYQIGFQNRGCAS